VADYGGGEGLARGASLNYKFKIKNAKWKTGKRSRTAK
jgi:hypothetical protein